MPRKSNVSIVSGTGDENGKEKEKEKDGINIEDLSMPRTMVQRLAKGVLPPNTQVQKDAITAMSKGATVFINYISHAANEHTLAASRKTINPTDVLLALRDAGFEFMLPRLEAELAKYNEIQTAKRNEYRKKVREGTMGSARRKSAVSQDGGEEGSGGERTTKKMKAEGGAGVAMETGDGAGDERPEEMDEEEGDMEVGDEADGEGVGEEVGDVEDDEDEEAEDDDGQEQDDEEVDEIEDLGDHVDEGGEGSGSEEDSD